MLVADVMWALSVYVPIVFLSLISPFSVYSVIFNGFGVFFWFYFVFTCVIFSGFL